MRRKLTELEADMSSKLADVSEVYMISKEVFFIILFDLFSFSILYDLTLALPGRETIQ